MPDLTTIQGLLDLLSLCNLVILGNVLDHRTYSAPNQDAETEATPRQRNRMDLYDHNAMPSQERDSSVYARGVCIQMLHWCMAHFEIQDSRTGRIIDENVAASHLVRQAIALQKYKNVATSKGIKGAPHCTPADLDRQIGNALKTYPAAYKIWTKQREHLEVLSLSFEGNFKDLNVVGRMPSKGYKGDFVHF